MSREHGVEVVDSSVDKLISHLDLGYRKREGDKLYLAMGRSDGEMLLGSVKFDIEGTKITGPDGMIFDLAEMVYHGPKGIYEYLRSHEMGKKFDVDGPVVEEDFN